jgi:hypothetical protein
VGKAADKERDSMNGEHDGTGQEAATVSGRRRTVQVKFRVTADERALIAEKMRLFGTDNLAAYLRKMGARCRSQCLKQRLHLIGVVVRRA